ncbi:MAG: serine hydrolase domain-containing protein [Acidimicrobiia bacterium]
MIEGLVEPGWGGVADALRANLERGHDLGAACCVYVDGRPVVDIWAGIADATTARPWQEDTLALVFSTTKGATAICANLLMERGLLDPDTRVAAVWPEFAANGKEDLPLRAVLSHRAGLPVIEGDFTLETALAWDPVVEQLASQTPRWDWHEPAPGYHVRSYGWIIGEVLRRVTGRSIGQLFAEEIAAPLGLDWWIGLPESEEPRVATLIPPPPPDDPELRELMDAVMAPGTMTGDAMTGPSNLFHYDEMWNTRQLHAPELPSSNGIASARAIARLYAATVGEVDGHRVLRAGTVKRATQVESDGYDRVIGVPEQFGLGFSLGPGLPPACGANAFGHPGAGGSLGFADPDARLGFGYAMNQMRLGVDTRSEHLVRSVYAALAK